MNLSLIHYIHLASDELKPSWPTPQHAVDVAMVSAMESTSRRNWLLPLRGVNNLPFKPFLVLDRLKNHVSISDCVPDYNITWGNIADALAVELIARAKATNKKIMLSWSGGTDSTVILIALLKHLSDHDRDLLTIALTRASILEASQIYFKYLHGQYDIVDFDVFVDNYSLDEYQKYIHVNGDPADQLCIGINSSTTAFLEDNSWGQRSFKDTRQLETLLTGTFNQGIARWLAPKLIENIESIAAPIESCYQAVWWTSFNYWFSGSMCATWCHTWWRKGLFFDQWLNNQFFWFADLRYQRWALGNCGRYDVLFGPEINQWKWMSQKYITDYTNDPFWLRYKTKMSSNNRRTQRSNPEWVALHGNQLLTIEHNLDELRELLPQCLREY